MRATKTWTALWIDLLGCVILGPAFFGLVAFLTGWPPRWIGFFDVLPAEVDVAPYALATPAIALAVLIHGVAVFRSTRWPPILIPAAFCAMFLALGVAFLNGIAPA